MGIISLIWPMLEKEDLEERTARREANLADVEAIRRMDWARESDLALSEARSLFDNERARRRIADEKASTYLLVTAALLPLLTYLESAIWDQKAGTAPKWLSLPFLLAAVAYLIGNGFWAFRTLKVRSFVTIDASDLLHIWPLEVEPRASVTIEYLIAARRNRDPVNEKISAIMLAHDFIVRAFYMFGGLLLAEGGWELVASIRTTFSL